MRRFIARPAWWIAGLALILAACGGDAAPTTTTITTTTAPGTTTTTDILVTTTAPPTTSTTTLPSGPAIAEEGDHNEIVEAVQSLLNCNGFGDLEVDGAFGPATRAAVEAAQEDLGREVTGAPDDEMLATLSRTCAETRRLEGEAEAVVVGNAAPEDPEMFSIALLSYTTLAVTISHGVGVTVTLTDADEAVVEPREGTTTWDILTAQEYLLEVTSPDGPMTFALEVTVTETAREKGDWTLRTDGISYKGTFLPLGTDADTFVTKIFGWLGHGVRSGYGEFDTDWYVITDPADMGLRGIFIEGFAFLFHGPDPNNPDRPETFERHRFEGPSADASGTPRPANYATTMEGITVGHTLADLKDAYGTRVRSGHNSEEYYYRFADSGGELCFYFDTEDEPTDFDPIVEIASECRH